MLPAIGSVSALAGQGRVGVVVSAQPLSDPENGRQLVALRIREGEQARNTRVDSAETGPGSGFAGGSAADLRQGPGPDTRGAAAPASAPPSSAARLPNELSPSEKAAVTQLQQRDQQVRQEEKAHAAVAGDLAGPINYVYQRGPDGRQYAVGGSVGIQASVTSGDPAEAKRQAGRIASAANAATNPSAQDYAAARQAYALGSQLGAPQPYDDRSSGTNLIL